MKQYLFILPFMFFLNTSAQNSGLYFDADENNYVVTPNSASLYPVNNFTIEFWMRTSLESTGDLSILNKGECVGNEFSFAVAISATDQIFFSFDCDGNCGNSVIYTCNTVLEKNKCYHVAITYSSTAVNIYINGALQPGSFTTGSGYCGDLFLSSVPMRIGTYNTSAGLVRYFSGFFDELRIWNNVRTATQISTMFKQELTGNETGLLLYYSLNDNILGSGGTVHNYASFSGTALDGTTYSQTSVSPSTESSCFYYTSIDDEASSENDLFHIYPNPTDRFINIEDNQNSSTSLYNISIYDITGREVLNVNSFLPAQIDLSGFEKGMYIVKTSGEATTSCSEISLY